MSNDLIEKLYELQSVIAMGGITRLSDSETIRQAINALQSSVQAPAVAQQTLVDQPAQESGAELERLRAALERVRDEGTTVIKPFWGGQSRVLSPAAQIAADALAASKPPVQSNEN